MEGDVSYTSAFSTSEVLFIDFKKGIGDRKPVFDYKVIESEPL